MQYSGKYVNPSCKDPLNNEKQRVMKLQSQTLQRSDFYFQNHWITILFQELYNLCNIFSITISDIPVLENHWLHQFPATYQ